VWPYTSFVNLETIPVASVRANYRSQTMVSGLIDDRFAANLVDGERYEEQSVLLLYFFKRENAVPVILHAHDRPAVLLRLIVKRLREGAQCDAR